MSDEGLWRLETGFWTGDADFYERCLADDAMMVFPPPTGVIDRGRIIGTIHAAPRWREVDMLDRRLARPNADTVALAYRASARRDGDQASYRAMCGSVYIRSADGWRLLLHQQSPLTGD